MNRLLKTLPFTAVPALFSSMALAAPPRVVFDKVKIEVRQEVFPEPSLKSGMSYGPRQKLVNAYWTAIRVDYTPVPEVMGRNEWCDDVTLMIRVVCPGPGAREHTAFTGVTKLWTVRLDGRTHCTLMAIPPQLLDRYVSLAPGIAKGPSVNKSQMKIEVLFRDASGAVLGRGFFNTDAVDFSRVFRAAGRRVVEGAVLPRNLTPWSYQSPAYYDLIRPEGIEPTSIPESVGGPPVSRGTGGRLPVRRGAPQR